MTLLEMPIGATAVIAAIESGTLAAEKLHQLGIRVGVNIKLLRKAPLDGPFLIEVSGREVAIGYGLCKKIQINAEK